MSFNVAAIDVDLYKTGFLYLPNTAKHNGFAEQLDEANSVLKQCIDECQITRFSGEIVVPDKPLFDGWAGAIPDLGLVKECLNFLRNLQYSKASKEHRPWWIRQSSLNIAIAEPEELKKFTQDVHECKFFEIFLANIISKNTASEFVELGQFLELSAVNDCMLFAWKAKSTSDSAKPNI